MGFELSREGELAELAAVLAASEADAVEVVAQTAGHLKKPTQEAGTASEPSWPRTEWTPEWVQPPLGIPAHYQGNSLKIPRATLSGGSINHKCANTRWPTSE